MELYTIRYNLHNYINKDNFDYNSIKDYIFLWKYTLIAIFAFLGLIFIYKFREIQAIGFIIIFIILVFIYIIYFEIGMLINDIENNKYLKEYGNFYDFSNIIFNETFDFIEDNDDFNNNNNNNTIKNINQFIDRSSALIDGDYLKIEMDNEDIKTDNFKSFIRNYISIIELKEESESSIVNIIFNTINYDYTNSSIKDIFDTNSIIYNYLKNNLNSNYYIKDKYLYITIEKNQNSIDFLYFNDLIKYNTITFKDDDANNLVFTLDKLDNIINSNYDSQKSTIDNNLNKKNLFLKINFDYFKDNYDNNYYIKYFLQKLIREIDNNNSAYNNLFNKINKDNTKVYLKIKKDEIKETDKLNKNLYIKGYINKLIDKHNYSNKQPNKIINYAIDNNSFLLLNFLKEYERTKEKIKLNMKYEDNKTNDEINDTYYNLIKKNNDLLKYIDVYKLQYVNKYIFLKFDKKNKIHNYLEEDVNENIITKYNNIENEIYYLINLENLNKKELKFKKILLEYINLKYEKKFENFNLLFEEFDLRKTKGLKKIIEDYNYEFIKIIIISIILITIICHIFYTELLRW